MLFCSRAADLSLWCEKPRVKKQRPILAIRTFVLRNRPDSCARPDARVEHEAREGRVRPGGWNLVADFRHFIFLLLFIPKEVGF